MELLRRQHSPETRAKMSNAKRALMSDPAKRAEISAQTKARMADPAVRQKIKDGMQRASGEAAELEVLQNAWVNTRPVVRARFIRDIFDAACSTSSHPGGVQ